jgi:hypothetical protein
LIQDENLQLKIKGRNILVDDEDEEDKIFQLPVVMRQSV